MENQIVETKNTVEIVEDRTIYNKNVGEKIYAISIKCKRVKTNKVNFNAVSGLMYLPVIKDGVDTGEANRWLNVHFTKDAFSDTPEECKVRSIEDLTTGTLYVKAIKIQAPSRYELTVNEETGEVEYPSIWIRGGIVGFEPYVVSEDKFAYHKKDKSIEAEATPVEATFDVADEN